MVRAWGDGQLSMPHGLAVDARSGAVWVTDVGRHQVGLGLQIQGSDHCCCVAISHSHPGNELASPYAGGSAAGSADVC